MACHEWEAKLSLLLDKQEQKINTVIKINLIHVKVYYIYYTRDWALNSHRGKKKEKALKDHYKNESFETMNRIISFGTFVYSNFLKSKCRPTVNSLFFSRTCYITS